MGCKGTERKTILDEKLNIGLIVNPYTLMQVLPTTPLPHHTQHTTMSLKLGRSRLFEKGGYLLINISPYKLVDVPLQDTHWPSYFDI